MVGILKKEKKVMRRMEGRQIIERGGEIKIILEERIS